MLLETRAARREILEVCHWSLCAPRDFDISPYFMVVKPTLVEGFKYKRMDWADQPPQRPGCTNPQRRSRTRRFDKGSVGCTESRFRSGLLIARMAKETQTRCLDPV